MWSRAGVLAVVVSLLAGEANPVWYEIAADGSITKVWNAEWPDLRAALAGVDIVPTIQNYVGNEFDGNLVANLLASPALREQHAEALTQLVVQNAYAGIDVDSENLSSTARADFAGTGLKAGDHLIGLEGHELDRMFSAFPPVPFASPILRSRRTVPPSTAT